MQNVSRKGKTRVVSIDEELYKELQLMCVNEGYFVKGYVEKLIREGLYQIDRADTAKMLKEIADDSK